MNSKEKAYCNQCKGYKDHYIVSQFKKHIDSSDYSNLPVDFADFEWKILFCSKCFSVTIKETFLCSESDLDSSYHLIPVEIYYPEREENSRQKKSFLKVPEVLDRIYNEIIDSYNMSIFTLCVAGIRAIIEGICVNLGIADNTLKDKINGLEINGHLGHYKADILHELRFLGNEALHELEKPSEEEIKIAIDITEHMLEHLYDLDFKKTELQKLKRQRII